jgi:hypothetical protein
VLSPDTSLRRIQDPAPPVNLNLPTLAGFYAKNGGLRVR